MKLSEKRALYKKQIDEEIANLDKSIMALNHSNDKCNTIGKSSEFGLDELERNYLKILQQNGSAPLNVISSKLALPSQTIKAVLEPYMLQEGLISKEKNSHRAITHLAEQHLNSINSQNEIGASR